MASRLALAPVPPSPIGSTLSLPSPLREESIPAAPKSGIWPPQQRHVLCAVAFFGFFNVYAMRVNLSVAAVTMQDHFDWSDGDKATILGAFFYGYMCTQLPGGMVATRFGGKWVMALGIMVTTIGTLVTPLVAKYKGLFIAVRVIEGLAEGVTYPCMHSIFSRWAPPLERSQLSTIVYSGAYMGTVLSLPIAGYLCHHDFLGGWPAAFYMFGIPGILWFILWVSLVFNNPTEHPWIRDDEREYILKSIKYEKYVKQFKEKNLQATASASVIAEDTTCAPLLGEHECEDEHDNSSPPWRDILTSMPVWAVVIAHMSNNTVFYLCLNELPSYMKHVLGFNIQHAGFDAALPYLGLFIVVVITGRLVDYLRDVKQVRTVVTRKVATISSFLLGAMFIVIASYSSITGARARHIIVVYLTLAVSSLGIAMSGFNVNHLDIAPRYGGVLMGMSNTAATIPGFAMPALAGAIATSDDKHTLQGQWRTVFFISTGILLFGAVFYGIFASGVKQPWADKRGRARRTRRPLVRE